MRTMIEDNEREECLIILAMTMLTMILILNKRNQVKKKKTKTMIEVSEREVCQVLVSLTMLTMTLDKVTSSPL
jgi:hypothetical protein